MSDVQVETETRRVTITIEDAILPVDEDDREFILETLTAVVGEILRENHDVASTAVEWELGHQYAQVEAACPSCGEPLEPLSVHVDESNGAYASVTCQVEACPWSGDAVYRIVDLEPVTDGGWMSAVHVGQVEPEYCLYG